MVAAAGGLDRDDEEVGRGQFLELSHMMRPRDSGTVWCTNIERASRGIGVDQDRELDQSPTW